jgi:nitrous oxidase accessory protein NosD
MMLLLAALAALLAGARPASALVLTADSRWQGEVVLTEDVLVPQGITLTIAPGTVVRVESAESTRTDPEYLSPLVELTVRGTLRAEGEPDRPILFKAAGRQRESAWAGILVDGGTAFLRNCRVEHAETAVQLTAGRLSLDDSVLSASRYGLVIQGTAASVEGRGNRIRGNDYGIVVLGSAPPPVGLVVESDNRRKNLLVLPFLPRAKEPEPPVAPVPAVSRHYGDEVLAGETVWRERVVIDGVVRVPEGSRLVILPGTVVEFGFRDTNGDGIGEAGLLIQGTLLAKGSPAAPIVFRSAGRHGTRGSWDAINIMNSAGPWNLVEHCRIEDAYRGLHFHFSRVAVTGSLFLGCNRGIQFQESTVLLRGNRFTDNRSAVQGRDSEVGFDDNRVEGNFQGVNFFRTRLTARGNRFMANGREGVRIREGATIFEENLVAGNRFGLAVMDAFFGSFRRNVVSGNAEVGVSLRNTDSLELSGNFIVANGLNGMSLQESGGRISGNLIADNGERGVGIQSFAGVLTGNNFSANGLYAVDLDGGRDVSAPANWWGGDPVAAIHDKRANSAKGQVDASRPAVRPFTVAWPLSTVERDLTWRGAVAVTAPVTVSPGATLSVASGTRVLFARGAGLKVFGRIAARGEPAKRVVFTSLEGAEPSSWDEIALERANGSVFSHCTVEYATWGMHSHFSRVTVTDSVFRRNDGGIRFNSGPLEIDRSVFTGNAIAIRSYRGIGTVRGSVITGNKVGIFVREKGGGLTVTGNNIFGNSDYNLRLGDFNDEDVTAIGNWWGEGDPLATIFDARREPGIGFARIAPWSRDRLLLTVPKEAGE